MKYTIASLLLAGLFLPGILSAQQSDPKWSFDSLVAFSNRYRTDSLSWVLEKSEAYLATTQKENDQEEELKTRLFLTRLQLDERQFDQLNESALAAIDLARAVGDKFAESEALFYQGNYYFHITRVREGLPLLDQALACLEGLPNTVKRRVLILGGMGYWRSQVGDFENAISTLHQGLAIAQADSMMTYKSYLLTLLSSTSTTQGDYESALAYESESLQTSLANNDSVRVVISRHNLADIYLQLGDYVLALEEAKEIENNKAIFSDPRLEASFNERMGTIYLKMKSYKQSEAYFDKAARQYAASDDRAAYAISICNQTPLWIAQEKYVLARNALEPLIAEMNSLNDTLLSIRCRAALASVWAAEGKHEIAQQEYIEFINYYQANDFWSQTAETAIKLASSYFQTAQYLPALDYAELAMENFELAKMKIGMSEVYELQYRIYKAQGDLANALAKHETYFNYVEEMKTAFAQRRLMEERVRQGTKDLKAENDAITFHNATLSSQNRLYGIIAALLVLGIFGVSVLYIRLRQSQQRLRRQKQHLEELNQTKDRFFGIIAHDLRNPIIALRGVGFQMEHFLKKQDPENLLKVAGLVDETAGRLNRLLDNLLSWALSQTGHFPYNPSPLPLQSVIDNTVGVFASTAQAKNIDIRVKDNPALELYADKPALHAIFRNLIANALKFTHPGGKIELSAEESVDEVICSVKDNGMGIPANRLTDLFSLKTTIRKGTFGEKGTGLGLILCKELVDLHRGRIYAHSQEGQGTTISFAIPKA